MPLRSSAGRPSGASVALTLTAPPPAEIGQNVRRRVLTGGSSSGEDGKAVGRHGVQNAGLGGDIAVHAAMADKMVRRDVEKQRDVGAKRGCRLKLVGGHLQNNHAVGAGIGQRAGASPILPPTATWPSGGGQAWPISAVVVDLPLVPVTATMWAAGAAAAVRPR